MPRTTFKNHKWRSRYITGNDQNRTYLSNTTSEDRTRRVKEKNRPPPQIKTTKNCNCHPCVKSLSENIQNICASYSTMTISRSSYETKNLFFSSEEEKKEMENRRKYKKKDGKEKENRRKSFNGKEKNERRVKRKRTR